MCLKVSAVIITHEVAGLHQVPISHPERPARYPAVMNAVDKVAGAEKRFEAPQVDRTLLSLVHEGAYQGLYF